MNNPINVQFSGPVHVFHERRLPEDATPVGYAALVDAYHLNVPLPANLRAIGTKHRILDELNWQVMTPRHTPAATLGGHLTFALKYEGLDLLVLKALFQATGPDPVRALVAAKPSGSYARRIWFIYEWLTQTALDLPDATNGRYVDVVDPKQQYGIDGVNISRYRVRNNLPGTPSFCPLVRRTDRLIAYSEMDLTARARDIAGAVPRDLLARTAAFLLLKDSRSTYAIEGERPPHDRIQRWGRAIGEAGQHPLDLAELLRLQQIVIGDARFVKMGLRDAGGFVGAHDRDSQMPLPEHISAKPDDLGDLINGMVAFDRGAATQLDPVIAAATLAFGFVYIHPFEDGNGRLHRYLIHHVLAQRGFNPAGLVFPVSSAILERIEEYKAVLESTSAPLLPFIEWTVTDRFNVQVTNDTADFYRFFDATRHAEFLYGCVQKTIDVDLPLETAFLTNYDTFGRTVEQIADMPDRVIDLMFRFLHQNNGQLSRRAREAEFHQLTDDEARQIETAYQDLFETPPNFDVMP